MKAIDMLISETDSFNTSTRLRDNVLDAMKKYAHQVATQALKDAAENAKLNFEGTVDIWSEKTVPSINKGSIINTEIKLP